MSTVYYLTPLTARYNWTKGQVTRHQVWRRARDGLLALLTELNSTGSRWGDADPCKYRESIRAYRDYHAHTRGLLDFPIGALLSLPNATLAAGCLLFLVTTLARSPAVVHLTVATGSVQFNYEPCVWLINLFLLLELSYSTTACEALNRAI